MTLTQLKALIQWSLRFKSHWYYWYNGQKSIAILSMAISMAIMAVCLVLTAGYSLWGIMIAVFLDSAALWLSLFYVVALRSAIPEFAQCQVDTLIATQFALPMLLGFVFNRVSTFVVAKTVAGRSAA